MGLNESSHGLIDGFEGTSYGGHGDVYRWLREHNDFVRHWITKRHASWEMIAARIGKDGVFGSRGNVPTRVSVWKVWQRVCRDVAAEALAEAAKAEADAKAKAAEEAAAELRRKKARNNPSRLPKDLQPLLADSPSMALVVARVAQVPVPVVSGPVTGEGENEKGPDGRLTDAAVTLRHQKVRDQLAAADQWMGLKRNRE